ncbi:MAG TPA: hypothetical protein VM913_07410 [Sphingomicrobium sp.]|nr:hypothetical protein [Sphingomicrobium sp.]
MARRKPSLSTLKRLRYTLKGHDPVEASWYEQTYGSLDGCASRFDGGTFLSVLNERHKHRLKHKLAFALEMAKVTNEQCTGKV